jgi:hypothetical protein
MRKWSQETENMSDSRDFQTKRWDQCTDRQTDEHVGLVSAQMGSGQAGRSGVCVLLVPPPIVHVFLRLGCLHVKRQPPVK